MDDHSRIWFTTPDREQELQFIREYLLGFVDRASAMAACERVIFIRVGHDPTREQGGVILDVYGDIETVLAGEREQWDELVADGPLVEWEPDDTDVLGSLTDYYGEQGARLHEDIRALATAVACRLYDAFETPPAAVDEYPEEDGESAGWYLFVHQLANHAGYSWTDEIDACLHNIETGLDARAHHADADDVLDQIDDLVTRLEATREEIDTNREAYDTS